MKIFDMCGYIPSPEEMQTNELAYNEVDDTLSLKITSDTVIPILVSSGVSGDDGASLIYQGIWDADTNTPTLVDGTGTDGHFYLVDVAGTQDLGSGDITFIVGDRVVYNGDVWQKSSATDTANWGKIYGNIGDQSDLQTALGLKTDNTTFNAHTSDLANPHSVTQTQIGLSNVDNTTDLNKPISTATQTALDLKADDSDLTSHTGNVANPHAVTQAQVGLGNNDNTADIDKPVSTAQQAEIDMKVEWKDKWVNATYYENDMVLDSPYTMIANKETTDKAGIDYIGIPYFLYSGTLTDHEITAKQVIFGNRYTASTLIQLTGFRISVVTGMAYSIFIITNPSTEPLVKQVGNKFTADSTGWINIDSTGTLVGGGLVFDLIAYVHEPDASPAITTLNYDYDTPNNASTPTAGEAVHANNDISNLKFNDVDDDAGDNGVFLNNVTPGDIITTGAMVWTVQSATPVGATMTYSISPAVQYGTDGVIAFDFETVVATPIIAGREVNANLATTTSGLYIADGAYADIVPDDNQYGLDVYIQEVSKSDDWDLVAMSGNAVGSGDDGGTTIEIVDNLTTQDSSRALSANQGYVLDNAKVANGRVLTDVPAGALFTDTPYDDTTIQGEVDLNTAKVTNVAHPLVETAVPGGAEFTDTVYTHPTTPGNKHMPSGGSIGQVIKNTASGDGTWQAESGGGISLSDVTYEALNDNGDVGTGSTQVSQGNHTHSYDNYNGWDLQVNTGSANRITSGENVDFKGSGATSVSLSGTTVTISSTADYLILDTVSELTSALGSTYGVATVAGYNTDGDGGGGQFIYDASRSGENDLGLVFNGWVRQYDGEYQTQWFGYSSPTFYVSAVGNDYPDRYGLDSGAKLLTIQQALDNMQLFDIGDAQIIIEISSGTYFGRGHAIGFKTNNRILIKGPSVTPNSTPSVTINANGENSGLYFEDGMYVEVRDIKIINADSTTTASGVVATEGTNILATNLHVDNCTYAGINANGSCQLFVDYGKFTNCQIGIRVYSETHYSIGGHSSSYRIAVEYCTIAGVYVMSSSGHIDNIDIKTNYSSAIGIWLFYNSRAHIVSAVVFGESGGGEYAMKATYGSTYNAGSELNISGTWTKLEELTNGSYRYEEPNATRFDIDYDENVSFSVNAKASNRVASVMLGNGTNYGMCGMKMLSSGGDLKMVSGQTDVLMFSGAWKQVYPPTDNEYTLGKSDTRWKTIYSASALSTASKNEARNFNILDTNENNIADELRMSIKKFTRDGKIDFSIDVGEMKSIFISHGLDINDYNFFEEDDNTYSINYNSLMMFILAM